MSYLNSLRFWKWRLKKLILSQRSFEAARWFFDTTCKSSEGTNTRKGAYRPPSLNEEETWIFRVFPDPNSLIPAYEFHVQKKVEIVRLRIFYRRLFLTFYMLPPHWKRNLTEALNLEKYCFENIESSATYPYEGGFISQSYCLCPYMVGRNFQVLDWKVAIAKLAPNSINFTVPVFYQWLDKNWSVNLW